MDYSVKHIEVRKYLRRNKTTNVVDEVTVSNRNNLPVDEHLRLLNLNDTENEYSLLPGDSKSAPEGESGADNDTFNISLPKM